MRNGRFAVAAAALAAMSLLAACGSSGSSSAAKQSPTTSGSGTTATKAPIKVGAIGSYGGANASLAAAPKQTIQAWAQWVNAHGGVSGHPIDLILKDDKGDVSTALLDVKELIKSDHVVAIVGESSNQDTAWAQYAASSGVPVVGGNSIDLAFATNPDFFATGANVFAVIYNSLVDAKANGKTLAFLYCAEAPICAQAVGPEKSLGSTIGVSVPLALKVSASATDYTAICQQLKASNVSSYVMALDVTTTFRVASSCAQQGVKAKIVATGSTITQGYTTHPAFDGSRIASAEFPFFDDSTPATKEYQDAISKYAPNLGDLNGDLAASAWVGGKLFEKAVAAAGTDTITPATVKQGLYNLKNETLGGLIAPVTYTQGQPTPVDCGFSYMLQNGKFSTPNGLTPVCAPTNVIAGVLKALGG